jgi:hypothetical protein
MTSDKEKADRQGRAEALFDEQAQRLRQEKRVEGRGKRTPSARPNPATDRE